MITWVHEYDNEWIMVMITQAVSILPKNIIGIANVYRELEPLPHSQTFREYFQKKMKMKREGGSCYAVHINCKLCFITSPKSIWHRQDTNNVCFTLQRNDETTLILHIIHRTPTKSEQCVLKKIRKHNTTSKSYHLLHEHIILLHNITYF